jgi:hypothetical protein
MVSKVHLFVGLVERAIRGVELAFVVALESGPRNHIENAIRPVALIRRIAAALGLQIVDILGIDLRAHVAGDVGIGNGNPVDGPRHLVAAAHVELVVRDPRARDVVGDQVQAVAEIGSGRHLDLAPAHQRGRGRDLRCRRERRLADDHGLLRGANGQLKVEHGGAAGDDHNLLRGGREALLCHGNPIGAGGQRWSLETAFHARREILCVVRTGGLDNNLRARHGTMVGIVHDSPQRSEHCRHQHHAGSRATITPIAFE